MVLPDPLNPMIPKLLPDYTVNEMSVNTLRFRDGYRNDTWSNVTFHAPFNGKGIVSCDNNLSICGLL